MKNFYILVLLLLLSGCEGTENKSGITMNDFINTVKSSTGENSIDCGQVEINENQFDTNNCMAEAFTNKSQFYAIYMLQGTDSLGAVGLAYAVDESLFFWYFDSDPTGGGSINNGKITKKECLNAIFSGNLNLDYYDVFSCQ